jgi:hypothetical protein
MPDRLFFPLMGLIAAAMIALAIVWPQGLGARSPGPFGHPTAAQVNGPAAPHPVKAAQLKGTL